MPIGTDIKTARKKAGLTQAELAKACGLAEITIRQYETEKRIPKKETIAQIANVLNCELSYSPETGEACFYEFRDVPTGEITNLEATKKWIESNMKNNLISHFDKLTLEGKEKVLHYAADLAGNPEYKK